MQVNESVDQLVATAAKLALAINEAATHGYLTDNGTLQELASDVTAAVRAVEDEYDFISAAEHRAALDLGEADHLEAQVENDLGDVEL